MNFLCTNIGMYTLPELEPIVAKIIQCTGCFIFLKSMPKNNNTAYDFK
jgi:hypothetical protein